MSGGEFLKKRSVLGLVIMLIGVAVLLYGIYNALTVEYVAANVPKIVENGFVPVTIGIVLLINGVVVQGFRKYYALIIHLIANIPYALAIIHLNNLAKQTAPSTNPRDYIMATMIYWIIGIIFNIGGIIANHLAKEQPAK